MASEVNKVLPDKYIRKGTTGQALEGIFNEDISAAQEVWFEYVPYEEDDDIVGAVLAGVKVVGSPEKMEYITNGSEFKIGLYKMVCAVKFSDTKTLYSKNRTILKVLARFEAIG